VCQVSKWNFQGLQFYRGSNFPFFLLILNGPYNSAALLRCLWYLAIWTVQFSAVVIYVFVLVTVSLKSLWLHFKYLSVCLSVCLFIYLSLRNGARKDRSYYGSLTGTRRYELYRMVLFSVTFSDPDYFKLSHFGKCTMHYRRNVYTRIDKRAWLVSWSKCGNISETVQDGVIVTTESGVVLQVPGWPGPPKIFEFHVLGHVLYFTWAYDTTRYGRLTCAQKLTRWPA